MERCGSRACGIDVSPDKIGHSRGGDVVDKGEGWEEEDCGWGCCGRVVVMLGRKRHVRGGEH